MVLYHPTCNPEMVFVLKSNSQNLETRFTLPLYMHSISFQYCIIHDMLLKIVKFYNRIFWTLYSSAESMTPYICPKNPNHNPLFQTHLALDLKKLILNEVFFCTTLLLLPSLLYTAIFHVISNFSIFILGIILRIWVVMNDFGKFSP